MHRGAALPCVCYLVIALQAGFEVNRVDIAIVATTFVVGVISGVLVANANIQPTAHVVGQADANDIDIVLLGSALIVVAGVAITDVRAQALQPAVIPGEPGGLRVDCTRTIVTGEYA